MSYLRHISTRRLLALLAATMGVLAGSAAAIALAAGGSGPTPPPKPLAQAVHDALAAPAVDGVTARISFTNHLVDVASLQGSDPLLTGAKGRLWATGDRLRLELQASSADGRAGDVQVLLDGDQLTVIETGTNTVYRAKLPQGRQTGNDPAPSLARIQDVLTHLTQKATLSDAQPSDVAGRPAYTVRISPRHDGGLLGGAEVAWDAEHGVPLRAAVYANGAADPVLELKATDISFGKVAASDLAIPEPAGAHVVDLDPSAPAGAGPTDKHSEVTGLQAVQAKVGFTIDAPATLVGLPRKDVRLVELDGTPGALVTYGQGLGGIAVLESPSTAQPQTQQKGGRDGGGLSLPKISINGASGQELDTALGTVVRFDRAGVGYIVAGSVPPTAAEAAARGL
jgi:outer membrane lipoprotein-sorting protein